MNQIECPVCHQQTDLSEGGICPQCGFEVRVALQPLPEEFKDFENKRLEAYRALWASVSETRDSLAKANEEITKLKEDNDQLKTKNTELVSEIETLGKRKLGVPFYLMQVDANRTYQLMGIDVGRTSFGSYVQSQKAGCQAHFCIDPSLDPTQFIIDCRMISEGNYELSLINNGTRRISINGSILDSEVRIMSPDVIEMDGYQFVLLRP